MRSANTKTTEPSRPVRRSAASAREAVLEMLKDDHKRVKKAFRDFEKLDAQEDSEECADLVAQTCTDLEVHAQLEEDLFYPALRGNLQEEDLLDEAEVEHKSAKMLIAELKDMSPDDEKFSATFTVLGEYVKHHIREEETEMFQQLERAKIDWAGLLESMQNHRQELMAEFGGASDEMESMGKSPRGRTGSRN